MTPMRRQQANTAMVVICMFYLAVVLVIIWNKAPTWDEGWFASPPYNLLHHGHFGTSTIDPQGYLLRAELTHINQRTYWVLPLSLLAQVPWYVAFGFGLVQMRLLTLVFGLLAIAALYTWTARLTGSWSAALVAGLLMAQDNILLWRSADGRMDVMCLALGLIGMAAYLRWRERSLSQALLIGSTFVCLAGLTHPNAIILLLCLIVTILVLDGPRLRWAHIVPFAVPFLIGGAAYAAWALRDLAGFQGQMLGNRATDRMILFKHPLNTILDEITRYKYLYIGSQYEPGRFAPLKIVLLITWFGGYLGRIFVQGLKSRTSVILALCGAIPVVVLTFFNAKNIYYMIYIVPFFAANAAVLFDHLWRSGLWARRFATAVLAATLLVSGAVIAKRTFDAGKAYDRYRLMSAQANRILPANGRLIAPADWAFGIGFDRVVQDDNLGFYSRSCPAVILETGLVPDEVENLRRDAPDVLKYRNEILTVYYQPVSPGLYRRVSCPAGTHQN
jgi:4-amino-4-deoxy-L-arabinose transferase-like glycosyltransferase